MESAVVLNQLEDSTHLPNDVICDLGHSSDDWDRLSYTPDGALPPIHRLARSAKQHMGRVHGTHCDNFDLDALGT